jgi:ABC-type bacteriocin/lantibiotic exporter with double-glycine peptidase domain
MVKPTFLGKLSFLLSPSQKRQLGVLAGLLLLGMLFEMLGLGILIPALGLLLNSDSVNDYPTIKPYIEYIGNPNQAQLVVGGMIVLVLIYLAKALFLGYLSWRQSKFTSELWAHFSKKMFLGYLELPYTFHLQKNSAELLRNIQTEVGQFTTVCLAAITLSLEFSVLIGIAFMLIIVEPIGAITVTFFLAVSAIGFHRLTKNKLLFWGEMRQFHAGLTNQHLLQGLSGVKDVKLMGREQEFLKEFSKHNDAYAKIRVKVDTLGLVPRYYLELLAVVGLAVLIILMIFQNKPLDQLLPTLGIFVAAAFKMIPSVNRMMTSVQQIKHAQPVINVLYDEFKMIGENNSNVKPTDIIQFSNQISIDNVCFMYPSSDLKALKNISLQVNKGESVGIIGKSGSGKSTLVDILLGLLSPDSGQILIDGKNIEQGIRSWQSQIGYVPQAIYLTDDTLKNNVAFGIPSEHIDDEAIKNAIRAAQLDEFIADLPLGLDTVVGERGVRLSGGQRQRIGIARALYSNPNILVLDEATSALDSATEKFVMEAVEALHGEKTVVIIAHRLSTLVNCDRIYKLDQGKVVSSGSTEEILQIEKNH